MSNQQKIISIIKNINRLILPIVDKFFDNVTEQIRNCYDNLDIFGIMQNTECVLAWRRNARDKSPDKYRVWSEIPIDENIKYALIGAYSTLGYKEIYSKLHAYSSDGLYNHYYFSTKHGVLPVCRYGYITENFYKTMKKRFIEIFVLLHPSSKSSTLKDEKNFLYIYRCINQKEIISEFLNLLELSNKCYSSPNTTKLLKYIKKKHQFCVKLDAEINVNCFITGQTKINFTVNPIIKFSCEILDYSSKYLWSPYINKGYVLELDTKRLRKYSTNFRNFESIIKNHIIMVELIARNTEV
jgi:hypothetical protein